MQERISRLEDAVKHLAQLELDREEYADTSSKMTTERFAKREAEHNSAFQKFLHWIVK